VDPSKTESLRELGKDLLRLFSISGSQSLQKKIALLMPTEHTKNTHEFIVNIYETKNSAIVARAPRPPDDQTFPSTLPYEEGQDVADLSSEPFDQSIERSFSIDEGYKSHTSLVTFLLK